MSWTTYRVSPLHGLTMSNLSVHEADLKTFLTRELSNTLPNPEVDSCRIRPLSLDIGMSCFVVRLAALRPNCSCKLRTQRLGAACLRELRCQSRSRKVASCDYSSCACFHFGSRISCLGDGGKRLSILPPHADPQLGPSHRPLFKVDGTAL